MRIEKLSPAPDRAGKYRVAFEDGTILRLYRQTVEDFGLYAGKELEEAELSQLRTAAGEMSAKMRAVRIVSATSISKKELQQRLIRKGEDPSQAQAAVEWMSDLDLLDDSKTARQIVDSCIRKGYGPARAKQALYEKRIPRELWEEALAEYPDQENNILEFFRSRLTDPSDEKAVKRCVDALLRRGHSYGSIRRALAQLSLDADEFPED